MTKRGNNISINCAVRHKKKIQQDFLPHSQRGLGDIPKSLGGKGGSQGGKERTKRFLFPPWWNKTIKYIRNKKVVEQCPTKQINKLLQLLFLEKQLRSFDFKISSKFFRSR